MDITTLGIAVDSRPVVKAKSDLDGLSGAARGAERSTDGLSKSYDGLNSVIKAGAVLYAAKSIYDMERALVMARVESDRLNSSLGVTFGRENVGREIQYLQKVADELGLSFSGASLEYSKFAAAAKGTNLEGQKTREIFEAVSLAGAKLGLSAEQQSGALNALQQMISKGTVQAEELRGQLGERIPGAFQMAARAMGVTNQELGKMLEQGQVTADVMLPKLASEMVKTFGDGSPIKTAQSELNRLSNAWGLLVKNMADTGAADAGVGLITGLTTSLKNASQAMEEARRRGWGGAGQVAAGLGGAMFGHETPAEVQARLAREIDAARQMGAPADEIRALSIEYSRLIGVQKIELKTQEQLTEEAKRTKSAIDDALKPKPMTTEQKNSAKKAVEELRRMEELGQKNLMEAYYQTGGEETIREEVLKMEIKAAEKAHREYMDNMEEGKRLYLETRNAAEQYSMELERIIRLYESGALGEKGSAEALETQSRAMDKAKKRLEDQTNDLGEFGKAAAKNIQSAMADFLFDPFSNGVDKMAINFANAVRRMIAEAQAAQIAKYLFGQSVGGVGQGAIGGIFGGSEYKYKIGSGVEGSADFVGPPSYAGGGFTGSGSRFGGLDGQGGFMAMLHPQETVVDHAQGQQMAPNMQVNVINESGHAMSAKQQGQPKFDGEKWVLSVVMSAASNNPGFRAALGVR